MDLVPLVICSGRFVAQFGGGQRLHLRRPNSSIAADGGALRPWASRIRLRLLISCPEQQEGSCDGVVKAVVMMDDNHWRAVRVQGDCRTALQNPRTPLEAAFPPGSCSFYAAGEWGQRLPFRAIILCEPDPASLHRALDSVPGMCGGTEMV